MSDVVASLDKIRREAYRAVDDGMGPEACRYPAGSAAARAWLADYLLKANLVRGDSHRSHVQPAEAIAS